MMRTFSIILLVAVPMISMADDIFITSHNTSSNRYAVFEDNEKVAYLYLTEAGKPKPIKDAIAYSRVPPVSKINWKKIKKTGDIPPLTRDVASAQGVIQSPSEDEFSFKWSAQGNAVALLRNGKPIAFTSSSEKFGYSRAVTKSSRLAYAWDQNKYAAIFGK